MFNSKTAKLCIGLSVLLVGWYTAGGGKDRVDKIASFRHCLSNADASLRNGNLDEAVRCWKEALCINPGDLGLHNKLGLAYMHKGDVVQAEETFKQAIDIRDDYPEAHFNLALISAQRKEYPEALKHLDATLAANALYPRAHYLKSHVYSALGKEAEARRERIAEINVHPGSVEAWREILAENRERTQNAE